MFLKQKKKIALVNNSFWYARRFRSGLMRHLKQKGFEVYVLAPEGEEKDMDALKKEGFQVISFEGKVYSLGFWKEFRTLWNLIAIYRRHRFDLTLHYTIKPNIYGAIAALLSRTPCISITTGLGILKQHPSGILSWTMRRLYQVAVFLSREIWFLNEDDRAFFLSKKIAPASKTFLLRSEGVDAAYFHPKRQPARKDTEKFRLLYLGRMLKSKGLEELQAAAEFFREKQLPVQIDLLGFFVGDHPDAISPKTIKGWEALGNIRYLGAVEDVRPYLQTADAVVLPSYGEGMSRSLLEACSMAKPVIASDVEGCREIVRHEVSGFLCAPQDSARLIDAIMRLFVLSPKERQAMGMAGREIVLRHFSERAVLEQYEGRIWKKGRQGLTVPITPVLPAYAQAVNTAPA